jgi:hypothetical protein
VGTVSGGLDSKVAKRRMVNAQTQDRSCRCNRPWRCRPCGARRFRHARERPGRRNKSAFGRCPKRRLGVRPLSLLVAPKLLGLRSSPLVGPPLGLGLAPLVASARRGIDGRARLARPLLFSVVTMCRDVKRRIAFVRRRLSRYTVVGSSASGCQTRSRARSTAMSLTSA